jgi:hypothetical protein
MTVNLVPGFDMPILSGIAAWDATTTATPRDPYGSYAPAVTTSHYYALMTIAPQSTRVVEKFVDEEYRFPSTFDFNTLPGSLTGNWDSTDLLTVLVTELQVFDIEYATMNCLRWPGRDYTTNFLPAGNPDYSGLVGGADKTYYRVYQGYRDNSNGILAVPGITDTDLSSGNVLIDIKVPTKTVWLSLNADYDEGTFTTGAALVGGVDGEGCRIDAGEHAPSIDGKVEFTLGPYASDPSTDRLLFVRVRYASSAIPNRLNGSGLGFSLTNW